MQKIGNWHVVKVCKGQHPRDFKEVIDRVRQSQKTDTETIRVDGIARVRKGVENDAAWWSTPFQWDFYLAVTPNNAVVGLTEQQVSALRAA